MSKIKIGVCGASGYAGMELLTILRRLHDIEIDFLTSESQADVRVGDFDPRLTAFKDRNYVSMKSESIYKSVDVVFLALPHEAAAEATPRFLENGVKVIDLSAAYRIKDLAVFEKYYKFSHPSSPLIAEAVYGLCEHNRAAIKTARLVANPGCYPTSILMPLVPLLKNGVIKPEGIIIDAKSGFTGRGRKVDMPGLFNEFNENFYAYGIGNHRHRPEIEQQLSLAAKKNISVTFTPHVMPVDRGIYSTIYVDSPEDITTLVLDTLEDAYSHDKFVTVFRGTLPQVKWVAHTNECHIGAAYDKGSKRLVIVSAIDNLVKGAAGQAVQNFNIMTGRHESDGLI